MEQFPVDPVYSSCSYLVNACLHGPGAAKESLHCGIQLFGIDPLLTIYINRSLPICKDDNTNKRFCSLHIHVTFLWVLFGFLYTMKAAVYKIDIIVHTMHLKFN